MDIDEAEVKEGEEIAPQVRKRILEAGDEKLLHVIKLLPEESWARLRNIMKE